MEGIGATSFPSEHLLAGWNMEYQDKLTILLKAEINCNLHLAGVVAHSEHKQMNRKASRLDVSRIVFGHREGYTQGAQ
jgi:hypothetical protein